MPSYTSYLRQMAVLDADDNEIESWITVRGNHIPIKKGQSKEDAVKSFIEKKGGNAEKKSKPESKNGEKTDHKFTYQMLDRLKTDNEYWLGNGNSADKHLWAGNPKDQIAEMRKLYNSLPDDKKPEWLTEKDIDEYEKKMLGEKKGGETEKKDYTIAHKDKSGNTTVIAEVSHHDIGEKEDKAYNDKGLYQDALNELDDQIAEKEKELENIHLSMTENAEAGYFDIASANMEDIEFVKGQLEELKKKREKLAGSSKKD